MAEKRMANSKLNARGLEAFVSEDQAQQMADHQGSRYYLLVEAHVGPKTVKEDGAVNVQLIPDLVELIPSSMIRPVQDFMQSLTAARPGADQPLPLAGESPDPDTAAAALGEWDGNPDAEPTPAAVAECPNPWCGLSEGHEGEHDNSQEREPAAEGE